MKIQPVANVKRKQIILNILCFGMIIFFLLLLLLVMYSPREQGTEHVVVSIFILLLFLIISIVSLLLSQKGKTFPSSLIVFILIYTCICYGSINWGTDLPTVLIALFITVLMSGILINSKSGLLTAILLSLHLYIFYYLASHQIITPNYAWKNDTFNLLDVIEYSSLLIFAALFSWLSNSQLEKTLVKYKESEALLQIEKDNLEIKVKERTEEIKALQIDKINSMYRLVEFGRISSGLFHDIMSPLTNITLNLQMLKIDEVKAEIKNLTPSIKKIDNLITQSRKHIKIDNTYTHFDVGDEITSVMDILKSKAVSSGVKLIFPTKNQSAMLYGSPTLFSHIIMNLISNGIDAHGESSGRESGGESSKESGREPICESAGEDHNIKSKIVTIKIKQGAHKMPSVPTAKNIFIKVSDNGEGIAPEIIQKIFEPFYTTKQERGCGIGLSSTKHILEKYFYGTIGVKSRLGKGTTFTMMMPVVTSDTPPTEETKSLS